MYCYRRIHRSAPAVAMGLPRDLATIDTKMRGGSGPRYRGHRRHGFGASCGYVVHSRPIHLGRVPCRMMQSVAQPAPALLDVALRNEDLEKALRSALAADQCAIGFGERTGGEQGGRPASGVGHEMVAHAGMARGIWGAIEPPPGGGPAEGV